MQQMTPEEMAKDFQLLCGGLAFQCLRAEREAYQEAGADGLERASFLVRVAGLPPQIGPALVDLAPGLRGRVELYAKEASTVRIRCRDVRLFIALHKAQGLTTAPELGIDPVRMLAEESKKRLVAP